MSFAGWAIYFIGSFFEGEFSGFLLIFAVICTPLGLATFTWRYNLIVSALMNRVEIPGHIAQFQTISTAKRRRDYVIDYEYPPQGQTYQYRNRIQKNNFARTLVAG